MLLRERTLDEFHLCADGCECMCAPSLDYTGVRPCHGLCCMHMETLGADKGKACAKLELRLSRLGMYCAAGVLSS